MKIGMRHLQLFILLFATSSLLFQLPSDFEANAADAWYNDSWENRKKITTSLNTEISSDLTNFPTLISFTDSDLTKTTESDGTDIVFTASDGTTELAYEIERFDSSTGEIIAWVNIPTVSASENTDIYIYYKGTASTPSTVWDSSYLLVYHLNQSADGTVDEITDASGTGNHGTAGGTGNKTHDAERITSQTEAKIGYGQTFGGPTETGSGDGDGSFIWADGDSFFATAPDAVTVEFWIKIADGLGTDMAIFGYKQSSKANANELLLTQANSLNFHVRTNLGKGINSDVDAATGEWTHIVATHSSDENKIYQDGTLQESNDGHDDGPRASVAASGFALGGDIDGNAANNVNNELIGDMDEFRISNTIRSADWVAASYASQNNPSSFLTIESEEPTATASQSSTCTKHVILGNCGTIAINNDEYHIIDPWSIIPTTEVMVGEPVSITLSTPHNYAAGKINSVSVYTEIFGSPTNYEIGSHIDYSVTKSDYYVSESELFQVAGATHRIVQDPDVKNLEMFEVVFTMVFAKPMDTSYIVVETKNMHGIPETIYLGNALKVIERPIELLTFEEKSKFEIIYEPELKASLRPDMDIEPNMGILAIDPEPVVSKVTCGNGTILKDKLCVANEMSFYFFFKQFTRLFG